MKVHSESRLSIIYYNQHLKDFFDAKKKKVKISCRARKFYRKLYNFTDKGHILVVNFHTRNGRFFRYISEV